MKNATKDFKEFLMQGDVVSLAVAVIIATAFGALIASFVENIITPLIAAIFGEPDFGALDFTINGSSFGYGLLINALLSFIIIAAVIFFLVVRPYNAFRKRGGKDEAPAPPEYVVESGSSDALPAKLNSRSADGWKVVSVSEGSGGSISAVLVKE